MKIIISGGGTGGHVYPALAIANALKRRDKDIELLFVGAKGKLEMEKVPKAGYPIEGLWISGFHRKLTLRNLMFPFKLLSSLVKAWGIVRRFKPDVAVGVGGYASGPLLEMAARRGVPILIQEQNSHAGVTNRILSKKATVICTAYHGMEKVFPKDKINLTGNPVRTDIINLEGKRGEALAHFGFDPNKKTLFVMGGSLGAKTVNESLKAELDLLKRDDIQVLWQAGRLYIEEYAPLVKDYPNIKITAFIDRMDLAYAMADVVVSRAGALSISELCLVGLPTILVPSPNVAEDHQTHNAMALVDKEAAILVKDKEAKALLVKKALHLLEDSAMQQNLSVNIKKLGRPEAANEIAAEVLRIAKALH